MTSNPQADEDLKMADLEVARKLRMLGKVVVTVTRGNSRDSTWLWDGHHNPDTKITSRLWDGHHGPDTKITSKKVVETNNISHAVK